MCRPPDLDVPQQNNFAVGGNLASRRADNYVATDFASTGWNHVDVSSSSLLGKRRADDCGYDQAQKYYKGSPHVTEEFDNAASSFLQKMARNADGSAKTTPVSSFPAGFELQAPKLEFTVNQQATTGTLEELLRSSFTVPSVAPVPQAGAFMTPYGLAGAITPGYFESEVYNTEEEEVRKVKRILSNRASAKRSRQRRQERLEELEQLTTKLKVENSLVFRKLAEAEAQLQEFRQMNRSLSVEVEKLRTKAVHGSPETSEDCAQSSCHDPASRATEVPIKPEDSVELADKIFFDDCPLDNIVQDEFFEELINCFGP